MKTVKFSIEGYRPFSSESIHRGVTLDLEEDLTAQKFLDVYKSSLNALYRHEERALNEHLLYGDVQSFKEENNRRTRRVRYIVEGYQPGTLENVKRKFSIDLEPTITVEEFLKKYKEGLDRLYRHEEICCNSTEMESSLLFVVS